MSHSSQTTDNTPQLTAETVASVLTQPVEAAARFLQAGPTIYDTAGPLRIPRMAPAKDIANFTGESAEIPESTHTFGEARLLPSGIESIKTLTRYSNELARQSVVAIEAALRARMVADVASRIDRQAFGVDHGIVEGERVRPPGMFQWYGHDENWLEDSDEITLETILRALGVALGNNLDPNTLTVFMRPDTYMGIRTQRYALGVDANDEPAGDGGYMIAPDASGTGLVVPVFGTSVTLTPNLPAGKAAIVDMSRVAVARDLAPTVTVLRETFGDYDEQAIRVVARYDWQPLDETAIIKLGDPTGVADPEA